MRGAWENTFLSFVSLSFYLLSFYLSLSSGKPSTMGFLGVRQRSTRKQAAHPKVTHMKRTIFLPTDTKTAKKAKHNHVPFLDGLPQEILEQIFVESGNPEFVLANKAIFSELNSTCMLLRSKMVMNWVEEKEPERVETRETTATAEPEQNGQNEAMTQEQIDQDINNHIHHPQTFHIDDMVVDRPTPPPPQPQPQPQEQSHKDTVTYTLPVDQLKWKFITSELLESLEVEISGKFIPSHFAAIDASQRQKDLLPLFKKSGLKFQCLNQVLTRAAKDPEHFKHLVKLDFGAPTIACLIAALRHTDGEALLQNTNNMDLLPNWLIRSGYYVDKLSSDELWSFLVAHPDRNLVRYFLQLGVLPSERLLHQIPAL